jgi:ribokinase
MFGLKKKLDFLAIGDVVTDAFIELLDANVHCDINDENCTISMRWGDKIPYKDVVVVPAVGNSPNASVAATRLGLTSGLLTWIGDDEQGRECLSRLKDEKVETSYITSENGKKTNYHYVLRYEAERTILVKHSEFSYAIPEDMPAPKWIYLSSLAENSLPFHDEIMDYVEAHPDTKLAFQPGTFQMKFGYEKLKRVYERTDYFFCNKEEAQRIFNTKEHDMKKLLAIAREHGPKVAIITDGPNGAYVSDGNEDWFIPMYPDPKPPIDRTGAGDATSSTFIATLALGKSIPEALTWGPVNSMSVVQYIGAQEGLLSRKQLEEYIEKAPENYKPKKI